MCAKIACSIQYTSSFQGGPAVNVVLGSFEDLAY
jgi:hypothetical protein